jgi:Sec-independent protein secretion pathway component TatC
MIVLYFLSILIVWLVAPKRAADSEDDERG